MISAAFAHTDTADADTMQALGERLLQREEFLRANDIALLVWAFGRAKANVPGLLDALTKPVLENPKTLRKLSGKGRARCTRPHALAGPRRGGSTTPSHQHSGLCFTGGGGLMCGAMTHGLMRGGGGEV